MTDTNIFRNREFAFVWVTTLLWWHSVAHISHQKTCYSPFIIALTSWYSWKWKAGNNYVLQQDKSRGGHLWPTLLLDSCSRITKRWPVSIFCGIGNAAGVNASTLYHSHLVNQVKKPKIRRRFVKEIALAVIRPWAQKRLVQPTLPILFPPDK